MSIVFACAVSHAPGLKAWTERATQAQQDILFSGFAQLRARLAKAKVDHLVVLTSEHWTNFFYDHVSPFCIGRAESYSGPVEPWLKLEKYDIAGDPVFASSLIDAALDHDIDVGFSDELQFDHGTMLPLHYLRPEMDLSVTPVFFNTLAPPQPTPRRALMLGGVLGEVCRASSKRIGLIATGGLSHDPGERNHGRILEDFDRAFMDRMAAADLAALGGYTREQLGAAGAGAFELLAWIALAGAMKNFGGEVIGYAPVKGWATGMGLMSFDVASAS